MKKHLISLLVLFLFLSTSIVGISTQNEKMAVEKSSSISDGRLMNSSWPMLCHDTRHTGRSPYNTENNRGGLKWTFTTELFGILASPTISSDGTIYIGGGYNYLYAIYPNGTEKWKYQTGFTIYSAPAIGEDGAIYFGSSDGNFYALNSDGILRWKYPTGDIYSSPAMATDGTIYTASSTGGGLFALNPNGTLKWMYPCGNSIGSPAIYQDIVYIDCAGWIYALYANNGTKLWNTDIGNLGSPAIGDDGTIYTATSDCYLFAIAPNGTIKWKSPIGTGCRHIPTIGSDGTIYIASDALYAINPDGTRKWSYSPGYELYATSTSQAVSADGTVYYGWSDSEANNGHIEAVNPDGTEQWREHLDCMLLWSSPAIGNDGTVYIGMETASGGVLYAFLGKKFEDPVLTKPVYGMIYMANHPLCKSRIDAPKTIAIGKLTFSVTHPDTANVSRVEFWVDGAKCAEVTTPPYNWTWTTHYYRRLGYAHQVSIVAVNRTGFEKSVGIVVWKFF